MDTNRSRTETQEGSSSETQIELHYGVVTELHFLSYQRKAARSNYWQHPPIKSDRNLIMIVMTGVDTDRFERKKRVATSFSYVKLPNLYLAATGISCLMLATCAFGTLSHNPRTNRENCIRVKRFKTHPNRGTKGTTTLLHILYVCNR